MTIVIEPTSDPEEWNRVVKRSAETNPFHRAEALSVLADHGDFDLVQLVGYNGQEPIGAFPVFETRAGPFTVATSPPRLLHTFQLGPAMVGLDGMKRRKVDRYRREFVDGCLEWIEEAVAPDTVFVRTTPTFGDVRPFNWNGFEATPYYTYVVDLPDDRGTLLDRFSRDARSNVRGADESEYTVEAGGRDALVRVFEMVRERHEQRDAPLRIDESFVTDLFEACGPEVVRPYVCRVDGEFATGMIALESDSTVYRWKGGARSDTDLQTTDLLDWHIMCDAMDRGRRRYDLVGANIPRLCDYKSKFDPEVATYYTLERSTRLFSTATSATRMVRRVL